MRPGAGALAVAVALAAPIAKSAAPCGASLGADVARAESKHYVVAWRPDPAPIAVSRHFALDIAVCPKPGAPAAQALRVDATMPAHRHGMNYRATVKDLRDGRFRAEGLMFHMPGHWEFAFDVVAKDGVDRATGGHELR